MLLCSSYDGKHGVLEESVQVEVGAALGAVQQPLLALQGFRVRARRVGQPLPGELQSDRGIMVTEGIDGVRHRRGG